LQLESKEEKDIQEALQEKSPVASLVEEGEREQWSDLREDIQRESEA
jgi:hypothetical protein